MRTIEVTQSGKTFRMTVDSVEFVQTCPYVGRDGEHEFTSPDYRAKFCSCRWHRINYHQQLKPLTHTSVFAANSQSR